MTIVHTEASTGWGGQEIRTFQEARWMRRRGHRVMLLAPAGSEIMKRFTADGFEARDVAFDAKPKWFEWPKVHSFLRRVRADVVATHSSGDSWVGLVAARAAKTGVALRYRHVSAPVRPNVLNRFLYGCACDHVLTTAECIRKNLIENLHLSETHVTTVPTGMQPPAFEKAREQERAELCERLRVSAGTRFIGCVAVLRSWKGQEFLLSAFDEIASKFPEHDLVLVGDGPYRGPLEERRDALSSRARVHFAGHQENPWPYFRAFDLAVLPSFKDEGIPQSLLQAMFAGYPVVGTAAGGIPEIVLDGRTGLIAAPRSTSDLARALVASLESPGAARARADHALELARARHTLDGMGETVLRIIQKVRASSMASS